MANKLEVMDRAVMMVSCTCRRSSTVDPNFVFNFEAGTVVRVTAEYVPNSAI